MPVSNSWNPATGTLTFKMPKGDRTVKRDIDDVVIDGQSIKTLTGDNTAKLKGNDSQKRTDFAKWCQRFIFDFITPLSGLPLDDPDRTIDPGLKSNREFWGDEDGTRNPAGLFYVSRADTIDFDEAAFAAGVLLPIQRRVK